MRKRVSEWSGWLYVYAAVYAILVAGGFATLVLKQLLRVPFAWGLPIQCLLLVVVFVVTVRERKAKRAE